MDAQRVLANVGENSRLAPAKSTVSFFDGEPSCKIEESLMCDKEEFATVCTGSSVPRCARATHT